MPRDRTIECLRHCSRFSVIRNEACNATFKRDEPYQRHVQLHHKLKVSIRRVNGEVHETYLDMSEDAWLRYRQDAANRQGQRAPKRRRIREARARQASSATSRQPAAPYGGAPAVPCGGAPRSSLRHRDSEGSQRVHKSRVTRRRTRSSSKSSSYRSSSSQSSRSEQWSDLDVQTRPTAVQPSRDHPPRRPGRDDASPATPRGRGRGRGRGLLGQQSAQLPPPSTSSGRNTRPDTDPGDEDDKSNPYVTVRHIHSRVPAGYRIAPSPSASSLVTPSEQDADDFIFDPSDPEMEILFDQDPDVFQLATELSETIPSVLSSTESTATDRVPTTLSSQTVPKQLLHNTVCEQLFCRNECEHSTVSRDNTPVSDIGTTSSTHHNPIGSGLARPPIGCGPLARITATTLAAYPENSVEDVIDRVQQHLRDTTGLRHSEEVSVNLIVRFGANLVSEICKKITNKVLQDSAQYAHPTETAFINVIDQLLLHTRRGGLDNPPPTPMAYPIPGEPRGEPNSTQPE